jgi:hypothetical protein
VQILELSVLPQRLAVCRLEPDETIPDWLAECAFWSVTRTDEELSVVLPEEKVPSTWQAARGWRCLKVRGPLDFSLTGIISSLASPLAEAGISIFAISTYDSDYVLVREEDLDRARKVLTESGHIFAA